MKQAEEADVKPGWYKSAMRDLGYKVRVHSVVDGRVFFTRLGMCHMSISSVETFRGIVVLDPAPPRPKRKNRPEALWAPGRMR